MKIFGEIGEKVPLMQEDIFLHEHIEYLRDFIHSGRLVEITEDCIGEIK